VVLDREVQELGDDGLDLYLPEDGLVDEVAVEDALDVLRKAWRLVRLSGVATR
jgi:hypothetical protein